MNVEGFETIDEYYDDKNKKTSEMDGWQFLAIVAVLAVAVVLIVATFVKGKLG